MDLPPQGHAIDILGGTVDIEVLTCMIMDMHCFMGLGCARYKGKGKNIA